MNLLLSTRCGSTVGMGLLVSLLACGGEVILEPVPEQGGSARAELEQARALPDPVERQLAILAVLTESRAFPDPEVERICETELQSPALRERCERFLERTHLRLDPTRPGDPSGARAGGETEACGDHTGRATHDWPAERKPPRAGGCARPPRPGPRGRRPTRSAPPPPPRRRAAGPPVACCKPRGSPGASRGSKR